MFYVDEPGYSSDINEKVYHDLLNPYITVDRLEEFNQCLDHLFNVLRAQMSNVFLKNVRLIDVP